MNGIPGTETVWYREEIKEIYDLLRASQTITIDMTEIKLPRKYRFHIFLQRDSGIRSTFSPSSSLPLQPVCLPQSTSDPQKALSTGLVLCLLLPSVIYLSLG